MAAKRSVYFSADSLSNLASEFGSKYASAVADHVATLYLFTREDLKHLLLPVAIFAALSVPDPSVYHVLSAFMWTWLHLLQFCVSNQSMDVLEDAANKPWRPIPSGRITVRTSRALRWTLLPMCLLQSVAYSVPWQGLSLAVAFLAHNELRLGELHYLCRGFTNAWGYASFNAGAVAILSSRGSAVLDTRMALSFACNTFIIITTTHAQDFRDVVGDDLLGRVTLPIAWPELSRAVVPLLIIAWSVGIFIVCNMDVVCGVLFCAGAISVAARFYVWRDFEADKRSYFYYNLWLAAAQVIHAPLIASIWSSTQRRLFFSIPA